MFFCLVKNHSIKYFDTNNSKVCTSISCLRPLSDYLTTIRTPIRPRALFSSAIGFCNLQ